MSTIVPENRDEAARILAGKMRAYIAANYARPITAVSYTHLDVYKRQA